MRARARKQSKLGPQQDSDEAAAAPSGLLALQRDAGNEAVGTLVVQGKFDDMKALTVGSLGQAVAQVQEKLNQNGAAPPLAVDGKFGMGTMGAVKRFQAEQSLAADGIVGPKTWSALGGAGPAPKSTEKSDEGDAEAKDAAAGAATGSGFDPVAAADQLYKATKGLGTDEAAVYGILEGRSAAERAAIEKAYTAKYGTSLDDDLKDDLSEDEYDRVKPDGGGAGPSQAEAKATRIHAATAGLGTDEAAIHAILDNASAAERAAIAQAYTAKYGSDMEQDLKDDLSEDEYDDTKGGGGSGYSGGGGQTGGGGSTDEWDDDKRAIYW